MEQVEDGIEGLGFGVVAGWSVDVEVVLVGGEPEHDVRGKDVVRDFTVRDRLRLPRHGRGAGDGEGVDQLLQVGLNIGVFGVEHVAAVDTETIRVDLWRVGLWAGEGPEAGCRPATWACFLPSTPTETSFAFGALMRKVTVPSGWTSGEI